LAVAALLLVAVGVFFAETRDTSLPDVINAGVLKVGTDPTYPPMEFYENGELVGFDIDFAKAIAEDLGVKCEFVIIKKKEFDWPEIVQDLNNRKFDVVISGVQNREDRQKGVVFMNYLPTQYHFIYHPRLQQLELGRNGDFAERVLTGRVVAVPEGTGTAKLVDELEREGVKLKRVERVKGNEEPVKLVSAGKADVTLLHFHAAVHFARQFDLLVSEKGVVSPGVQDFVGIAFRKQDRALQARVEDAFRKMKRDGRFKGIYREWLPQ